jgi:enoyl-CoA hydratase
MSDILTSIDNEILTVTLNRPDDGNASTDHMAVEITQIMNTAHEKARIVVLTGAGDIFCRGRAGHGRIPAASDDALDRRRNSDIVFDCYASIRYCKIPVIAKVRGKAVGFGCSLASVSDITIAADDAVFQINEMDHGILPTMVLSSLIDRGSRKGINYMVYSVSEVPAERAIAYGLCSDIAPSRDLDAKVDALCAQMLKAPAIATEGVKEYLIRAMTMDVPSAVDYARNLHAVFNSSSEMKRK